ncbi:MAG: hypothetical protein ABW061_18500 [Polyangiaceae bacterium]
MARAASPWVLVCLAALGCALPGCAEAPHGPLAGASDAWETAHEPHAAPSAPKPAPVWDVYPEVRHWPVASAVPFSTRGHQPEQTVEVRVNEAARASYAGLVTDTVFPEGSVLVELSRGAGHGYAMQKVGGAWSYFELDSQGAVLASGALPLCASCHAQAPADHVFGPPRAP